MTGIPEQIAIRVLVAIARDPEMIGRLVEQLGSMPNLPTATMGGVVFWTDITNVNGQQSTTSR